MNDNNVGSPAYYAGRAQGHAADARDAARRAARAAWLVFAGAVLLFLFGAAHLLVWWLA